MYLIISCGWLHWTCIHIPYFFFYPSRCSYQFGGRMTRASFFIYVRYTTSTYKHVHEQHYQWIWSNNNFLIILYKTFALERVLLFIGFHIPSCKFTPTWSRNHLIYIEMNFRRVHMLIVITNLFFFFFFYSRSFVAWSSTLIFSLRILVN